MAATHFSGPLAVGAGGVEAVNAAKTLTAKDDNGKVIFLGAAGGAITLPPASQNGIKFKFINTTGPLTTDWVISASGADDISGFVELGGALPTIIAGDTSVSFASAGAVETAGDFVEFISDADGGQWLVSGTGAVAASITSA